MQNLISGLSMKKFLTFIIACLLVAAALVGWSLHTQLTQASTAQIPSLAVATPTATPGLSRIAADIPTTTPTPTSTPTPSPLPESASVTVPYTLQAPFNVWDALHEDACEETSLIMVKHAIDGTPISSPDQADKEITDLVNWEKTQGYGPSITLEQLNTIASDYFGLTNGQVVEITSIDQVKQEIASGHPVILGMAGKLLGNPYFSRGGPNYHMLVAKGYDATGIITNEPGTWHGDGYHYDTDIFYTAIHNWNAQNILDGTKAYLVFK